ncbi:MAG: GAF domain-containing sensor histidine kinase [Chitinophagaceae bacterium]|nr:GAF domain-containing sensor histidine kinase [Chitinophagaceae bacterium]
MIPAIVPDDEHDRLKELYEYDILDSEPEDDFDEIVKMASGICNAPISLVTLVDSDRQWFKAKVGLEATETDRKSSFCAHAMLDCDLFVIPDTTRDARFYDNPLVTGDPVIRFYVGVPLVLPKGGRIGALCVIDTIPRQLTEQQQEVLRVLGKQVVKLMELRKKNNELKIASNLEREHRIEMQRISDMQSRMMSILAHDMRGPIGALKGLLDMDLPQETFKGMATSQVNVTLNLLDNIVEWGQLEQAGTAGDQQKYRLKELVQEILEGFSVSAALKNILLVNKVEDTIQVTIDQHALRFLLRNLITNAVKFTRVGSISVHAEATSEQLKVSVKDTGIGMEPEMAEHLFEGRRKTSRKGTNNEAGSGLGLSLIKEFIDKNKGSIVAESEQGKGTTVAFTLHLS